MTQNNILTHYIPIGALGGIVVALFVFGVKIGGYVERFETATTSLASHIEDHPDVNLGGIISKIDSANEASAKKDEEIITMIEGIIVVQKQHEEDIGDITKTLNAWLPETE